MTFRVIKEGEEERPIGYSAGVMLNMQHRSLYDPALSLLFQAGITPTKDQLGILGGVPLSFNDGRLLIGTGYIQRQIKKLKKGLPELLDSPDQLETSPTSRDGGGMYFVITYRP